MEKLNRFLPFAPPLIGDEEIQEVADTLRTDWITTGPKTKEFEKKFASELGAPGALAVNSCTAALHCALVTLGIGPGDEVITTPMTFVATANVIEHVGAKPVFVDVEPDALNIDPEKIEKALGPKTKAIIPVHYGGHPVDLDPILEMAKKAKVTVIEDAAHAIPAKYKGRMIGSGSNPVAFSFYATKNLTTAEGGMLTGDPEFLDRARVVSLHGMSHDAWKRYGQGGSWHYDVILPGFKYNMTDVQASIGLHQLRKLEGFQKRRQEIVRQYTSALSQIEAYELPVSRPEVEQAWHLFMIRLRPGRLTIGRDQLMQEMKERQIGMSVHFIPVHLHSYYKNKYGFKPEDFPVAYGNYLRMFSVPLSPKHKDFEVNRVIEALIEIAHQYQA